MSDHSKLPPSSAARRMQCPGSWVMEMQRPGVDSASAEEGILAHLTCKYIFEGKPSPSGSTEEMWDGEELYRNTLHELSPGAWNIEKTVNGLHALNWGTPDAWTYHENTLHVVDYKFGHRYVDAFENWQLLNYAGGIVKTPGMEQPVHISLTIVQPRCYTREDPVRTWKLTLAEAQPYFDKIEQNCLDSLEPRAPTRTGGECRDCSARYACPTLQTSANYVCDTSGDNVPFDLSRRELGQELRYMKKAQTLLNARISGLETEVLENIKLGCDIPGWRAEQGAGREKWAKPVEEIIGLGEMMGIDVSKPGVITPKQAIKAGLDATLVRSYSETPVGALTLVPDDGRAFINVFKGE